MSRPFFCFHADTQIDFASFIPESGGMHRWISDFRTNTSWRRSSQQTLWLFPTTVAPNYSRKFSRSRAQKRATGEGPCIIKAPREPTSGNGEQRCFWHAARSSGYEDGPSKVLTLNNATHWRRLFGLFSFFWGKKGRYRDCGRPEFNRELAQNSPNDPLREFWMKLR